MADLSKIPIDVLNKMIKEGTIKLTIKGETKKVKNTKNKRGGKIMQGYKAGGKV